MRRTRSVSNAAMAVPGRPLLAAALMLGAIVAPTGAAAQAVAVVPPAAAPAASVPANGVGSAFELAFWQSVTGSEDAASYEAYLTKYPDGTFSGLARAKIAVLQRALTAQSAVAAAAVAAAAAPAPAPAPMPAPVPAVLAVPQSAPLLAPTLAVVTAATPTATPSLAAAAPQAAEMIPASAALAPGEQSSPLANLLAQLRGNAQPATAPASAPLVTAAPAAQPAPAAAPALAAALPSAPAVAAVLTPAPSAALSYASARPVMLPVPDLAMPAAFCSTDQRNAFHNSAYRPAVEAATRNNEAAVTYLRQLQQTYDRGQLGRDTAVLNAIAAEARAYQAEAARAYSAQAALVHQFDVLMAVPVRTCVASAQ